MVFKPVPQKPKRRLFNRYTTSALAVLLILGGAAAVIITRRGSTEAATTAAKSTAPVAPEFSFTGATDWWQGATNKTSMALFHNQHDCFTSVEHKPGVVNAPAELQKVQNSLVSNGYPVTIGSTQTLTMQTTAGPQTYELHQSAVDSPAGASTLEGGQEFGYLQLSKGYVMIMGYCDTASELPTTIPALQAVKLAVAR